MAKRDDFFRFSIRFNLNRDDHRKAFERLETIRKGDKSEFCINCILDKSDENEETKVLIRQTIKECLKDVSFSNNTADIADKEEIDVMPSVLDFMNGL